MAMKGTEKPKVTTTERKVSFHTTVRMNKSLWRDFSKVFDEKSRQDFCSWAASNMVKQLMRENPELLDEWLQWQLKRQVRSKKKEA